MNVYVMRHGQTVWNVKKITQGRSNNRLSKRGKEETKKMAEHYKNVPFDAIFASPLMRTMQTANIMNAHHNVKIIKDDRLIEIDQGIFTGRKKSSLSEEELKLKNAKSKEAGMETYEECYNRAKDFVNYLKTCDYQNVLVVTHSCIASFIEDVILCTPVDFSTIPQMNDYPNSAIKKFKI